MSEQQHAPLLPEFARVARERYGQGVKFKYHPDLLSSTLRIDWILPDGTITDTLMIGQQADGTPSRLVYTREVRLRWEPHDTPESVLDDIEMIRNHPVRAYWKQQRSPKPETE